MHRTYTTSLFIQNNNEKRIKLQILQFYFLLGYNSNTLELTKKHLDKNIVFQNTRYIIVAKFSIQIFMRLYVENVVIVILASLPSLHHVLKGREDAPPVNMPRCIVFMN